MIRDPSDGSVREAARHQPKPLETKAYGEKKPVLSTGTSGLPEPSARNQERLDRSRDWLRKYRTNPESVIRMMGEQGGENV